MFISSQSIPSPLARVEDVIQEYRRSVNDKPLSRRSADLRLLDLEVSDRLADAILRIVALHHGPGCSDKDHVKKKTISPYYLTKRVVWDTVTINGCYGTAAARLVSSLLRHGAVRHLSVKTNRWVQESSNILCGLSFAMRNVEYSSLESISLCDAFIPPKLAMVLAKGFSSTRLGTLSAVHLNNQTMRTFPCDFDSPVVEKYGENANALAATSMIAHAIVTSPSIRDITLELTFSDDADGLMSKMIQYLSIQKCENFFSRIELCLNISGRLFRPIHRYPFSMHEDKHTAFFSLLEVLPNLRIRRLEITLHTIQDQNLMLQHPATWSNYWETALRGNKYIESISIPHLSLTRATAVQLRHNKDGRWRLAPESVPISLWPHFLARVNRLTFADDGLDVANGRADATHHALVHMHPIVVSRDK